MNRELPKSNTTTDSILSGTVLSASRRELKLLTENGIIEAKRAGQVRTLCAGDTVKYDMRPGGAFAYEQIERKNYISRSSRGQEQVLVANLDLLCIVTAASNQYSPLFIDRVLCVASASNIPALVIVNKVDLDPTQAEEIANLYRSLDIEVVLCSAKNHDLAALLAKLNCNLLQKVALLGLSGVGKSTILNSLIPEANRDTRSVSVKTGQGKQTTTLARGFQMQRAELEPLILIDLPGVQRFGIDHMLAQNLSQLFPEFLKIAMQCKYRDCKHLLEDKCAVKDALVANQLPSSRYESYQHLSKELVEAKVYQYDE